jgi:DNA-binding MarR family transcriptional regulator
MCDTPDEVAAAALAEVVPRLARSLASALESDPDISLSLRQYRVLQRLAERPHRTTELASSSGISQPSASATIAALEGRGLVERSADASDRRATLIQLSPAGRDVLQRATLCVTRRLLLIAGSVTPEQAQSLDELQVVLNEGMDRVREQLRGPASGG